MSFSAGFSKIFGENLPAEREVQKKKGLDGGYTNYDYNDSHFSDGKTLEDFFGFKSIKKRLIYLGTNMSHGRGKSSSLPLNGILVSSQEAIWVTLANGYQF